jgi:hypothetical protein
MIRELVIDEEAIEEAESARRTGGYSLAAASSAALAHGPPG